MRPETVLRIAHWIHVLLPGVLLADALHNAFVVHSLWRKRQQEWLREDREALLAGATGTLRGVSARCSASAFWPRSIAHALQPGAAPAGAAAAAAADAPAALLAPLQGPGAGSSTAGGDAGGAPADEPRHVLCGSAFLTSVLDEAGAAPAAPPPAPAAEAEPAASAPAMIPPQLWGPLEGLAALAAARLPAALLAGTGRAPGSETGSAAGGPAARSAEALAATARACQTWAAGLEPYQRHARRGWDAAGRRLERAAAAAAAAARRALPLPRVDVRRRSALRFRLAWQGLQARAPRARAPLERALPSQ